MRTIIMAAWRHYSGQLGLIVMLALWALPAQATLQHILSVASASVHPGQRLLVSVTFINDTPQTQLLDRPRSLMAELRMGDHRELLRLLLVSQPATPPPQHLDAGQLYQARYVTELPSTLQPGVFSLRLRASDNDEPIGHPVFLALAAPPNGAPDTDDQQVVDHDTTTAEHTAPAEAEDDPATDTPLFRPHADQPLIEVLSSAESVDEEAQRNPFIGNFYTYEPLYFLYGTNSSNAKFQISFKYRFINEHSEFAKRHPLLSNFYVAYTQTSFWDLASESAPFRDTNFKPEILYQFNDVRLPFIDDKAYFDFRVGYQHESNGQRGLESRSLNIAYLEPAFHWNIFGDYQLSLAPRIWTYVGGRDGNEDLRRFRGRSSLTATLSQAEGFQLETYIRGNPGSGNGSLQLDLSYPLNAISFFNLDFYLYGQYFTGYGESLLDFNRKDTRFRFGLGIIR